MNAESTKAAAGAKLIPVASAPESSTPESEETKTNFSKSTSSADDKSTPTPAAKKPAAQPAPDKPDNTSKEAPEDTPEKSQDRVAPTDQLPPVRGSV